MHHIKSYITERLITIATDVFAV